MAEPKQLPSEIAAAIQQRVNRAIRAIVEATDE